MPRLTTRLPAYRHHKASDQAFVELNGTRLYLGRHGTDASREEYNRLVSEWLANGRRMPPKANAPDLSIAELIAAYFAFAQTYYRDPDGKPTSEIHVIRTALRVLNRLYGRAGVSEFGPLALKAVRQAMIDFPTEATRGDASAANREHRPWSRKTTNKQVDRIKRLFRWGVANELVPASVYHGLQAVTGLKKGRTDARENEPVRPVPESDLAATMPFLSRTLRAMVEVQLLTGARPGEITLMRTADIDRSGRVWTYKPRHHKTEHHGHTRTIYIGPRAQKVLEPFLRSDLAGYVFRPADAEAERRQRQHEARKTPPTYGNRPGTNRKLKPKRMPGERYTAASYRRAIDRACQRANAWAQGGRVCANDEVLVEPWHPNQLRHNAATRLRKEFGIEAAQVILGHATMVTTEIYAEKNIEAALRIMTEVG